MKSLEAKFTIRAVNKTQKAFAQINHNVSQMNKRFSRLGRGLGRLKGAMASVFIGREIVDTITKFEKLSKNRLRSLFIRHSLSSSFCLIVAKAGFVNASRRVITIKRYDSFLMWLIDN